MIKLSAILFQLSFISVVLFYLCQQQRFLKRNQGIMKTIILLVILLTVTANDCFAQNWMKLIPLESTREEVEKFLGQPDSSFPTYAIYRNSSGKFHVWYSTGECRKNAEGRQYKVRANLMTHLLFYFNPAPLLKSVIPDASEYTRQENYNKTGYLYISKDESFVYETYSGQSERVKSVDMEPSKSKKNLICKSEDLK